VDGSPPTITFISHILHSEEDAAEPHKINPGLFSTVMQAEGKVIIMTLLLHLFVSPCVLFSSISE